MQSVLVSALVNLGDVVMITSAIDLIRRHVPNVKIGVLVRPEAAELLIDHPLVDEVIVYAYRSGSLFQGFGEARRQIRAGGYDVYLSLDRRFRGAMLALLAGVPTRIGPDFLFEGREPRRWIPFLLNHVVAISPEMCRGDQTAMFQGVVRRALSVDGCGKIALPPLAPFEGVWRRPAFDQAQKPVVGFCVKTNEPSKTWSPEAFRRVMRRLKDEFGGFFYVTGGPGDRAYIDDLLKDDPDLAINAAGQTSLMELAALAVRSELFITLDNGAAHVVANSGLSKLVCILISTTPEKIEGSMPQARFIAFPDADHADAARLDAEVDRVHQTAAALLR